MGNQQVQCLQGNCTFKFKESSNSKFYSCYQNQYRQNSMGIIAITTLKQFEDEDLNTHQSQQLKISSVEMQHYQRYEINRVDQSYYQQDYHIPISLNNLSPQQKTHRIQRLLRHSYIFVDLSQLLEGPHRKVYEKQIKQQLMRSNISLLSVINEDMMVEDMIRQLDPIVIGKLSEYVRFCEKVSKQFSPASLTYYSQLLINLKAYIIQKHNQYIKRYNNSIKCKKYVEELIDDVRTMCKLIVDTIYLQYSIRSIQNVVNFYHQINIYTLVMSIIFNDSSFYNFLISVLQKYFNNQFKTYKKSSMVHNKELVKALMGVQSQRSSKRIRNSLTSNNIASLLDTNTNNYSNIFRKSLKIIQIVNQKKQPISKLKVFYELMNEVKKQFNQLANNEKNENVVYNRESMCLIAKWLLNKQKQSNIHTIISTLITYWFIHDRYRQEEKGSCLIPFVEEAERIIHWND